MNRQHPYGGYGGPPPGGSPGRPPPMRGPGGGPPSEGHHPPPPVMGQGVRPPGPPYGNYPPGPSGGAYGSASPYGREGQDFQNAYQAPGGYGPGNQRPTPPPNARPQSYGTPPQGGPGGPPAFGPPIHYDRAIPNSGPGSGGYGPPPGGPGSGPSYGPGPPSARPPMPAYDGSTDGRSGGVPPPRAESLGHGPPPYGGGDWEDGGQPRKRSRVEDEQAGLTSSNDMSYQTFLQERLKRERPCRTLFVRNVDFRSNVIDLKRRFESFGELKSWFDLIEKRGLAFISYFDIRAAEAAKQTLQGMNINGRELDVHYSLPRESEMTKRCDREKDQGTLFLVLKRAPDDLNDPEIMEFFGRFGEIKNLRPYKDQANCRFIEYYDCRAAKLAHDQTVNSTFRGGGTWDVKFAWDAAVQDRLADMAKHERDAGRGNPNFRGGARGGGHFGGGDRGSFGGGPPGGNPGGYGRPPPPGGGGMGGPPANYGAAVGQGASGGPAYGNDYGGGGQGPVSAGSKRPYDYDERDSTSNEPPMRRWGQNAGAPDYQSNGAGGGGYGPRPNSYGPGQDYGRGPPGTGPGAPPANHSPYGAPPRPAGPGAPSSVQSPPNTHPSGAAAAGGGDNRLEQAQKVQQLLASLKPGGAAASPSTTNGTASGASAAPAAPGLPSNIAALLKMAQSKAAGNQK